MVIVGVIPEHPTLAQAKQVFRLLGPCPCCCGVGWLASVPYLTVEQESCTLCGEPDRLFWRDGLEYYQERGHTYMDTANSLLNQEGKPVCYGFMKQCQESPF